MFRINKAEPAFFTINKKKVKLPKIKNAWGDKHIISINSKLRNYILSKEQYNLCAYCEKEINSDSLKSNIDHFKKRVLFPEETLNYENLFISCNNKNRCSNFKGSNRRKLSKNDYENIINPTLENPSNFFNYLPTGEIYPKSNLDKINKKKAIFTIEIFQLNEIDLVNERKTIMKSLFYLKNQISKKEVIDILNSYRSFIINIYNKQLII